MMEKWKDIPGYEHYYAVSNYGQIMSYDRIEPIRGGRRKRSGKTLKQTKDKDGYLIVSLRSPFVRGSYKVHRIVAAAFIENNEQKEQVNHKDGVKSNNHVSNLEWVTQSENMIHAFATGLRTPVDISGEKNPRYKTGINTHGNFNKKCEHCGNDFVAKIMRYRFCSRSCVNKSRVGIDIAPPEKQLEVFHDKD